MNRKKSYTMKIMKEKKERERNRERKNQSQAPTIRLQLTRFRFSGNHLLLLLPLLFLFSTVLCLLSSSSSSTSSSIRILTIPLPLSPVDHRLRAPSSLILQHTKLLHPRRDPAPLLPRDAGFLLFFLSWSIFENLKKNVVRNIMDTPILVPPPSTLHSIGVCFF